MQAFHPRTHDNMWIVWFPQAVILALGVPHDDFACRCEGRRFEPSAVQRNCLVPCDVRNLPTKVAVLILECEVVDQVSDELRLVGGKFDVRHAQLQVRDSHFQSGRNCVDDTLRR